MNKQPAKKKRPIKDYVKVRTAMNLTQTEFWGRLGVGQSRGSRYESGVTPVPLQTAAIAHSVYIEGSSFDVRDYQK